jgi:transcriptional regulator with XRE-family HTH domain
MAAAREVAAERGHALEEVASEAGVRVRVTQFEVSASEVSLAELAELSRGLGVRLSELIARAEEIEREGSRG